MIRRIGQFVLNRGTRDFRDELYEFLIGAALLNGEAASRLSKNEIAARVEEIFNLPGIPIALINNGIRSLLTKGKIQEKDTDGGMKYNLSDAQATKLRSASTSYKNVQNTVREQLAQIASAKLGSLSKSSREKLFKTMAFALALVSKANSVLMVTEGRPTSSGMLESSSKQTLFEFFQQAAMTFFSRTKANVVAEVMQEFFDSPTPDLESYLHSLWGAYHVFQVLHLDPECQCLTAEEAARISIYLDTNIIINSLVGPEPFYTAINTLFSIMKNLGMSVLITRRTKEEFLNVVHGSRKSALRIDITKSRFEKTQSSLENGFLKDYLRKKIKQPTLTPAGYFGKWQQIERILERRHGFEYDDTDCEGMHDHSDYSDLYWFLTRQQPEKADYVIDHDACHILMIQSKREEDKAGILGPRDWFLTLDYLLGGYERKYWKRRAVQSCIHPDVLTQILLPVLAPDTKNRETSHLVAALFRTRLPEAASLISEKAYAAMCGPWMDAEDLTPEDIALVIGREHVRSFLKRTPIEQITSDKVQGVMEKPLEELRIQKAREKEERERKRRHRQVEGLFVTFFIIAINVIIAGVVVLFAGPQTAIPVFGFILAAEAIFAALLKEQIQIRFGFDAKVRENSA